MMQQSSIPVLRPAGRMGRRSWAASPELAVDWPEVARLLLISRALDQIEEDELLPSGKVRYQFSARGHELVQILLGLGLDHAHDAATVYYRSRPFMLASGLTPVEALSSSTRPSGSPRRWRMCAPIEAQRCCACACRGSTATPRPTTRATKTRPPRLKNGGTIQWRACVPCCSIAAGASVSGMIWPARSRPRFGRR